VTGLNHHGRNVYEHRGLIDAPVGVDPVELDVSEKAHPPCRWDIQPWLIKEPKQVPHFHHPNCVVTLHLIGSSEENVRSPLDWRERRPQRLPEHLGHFGGAGKLVEGVHAPPQPITCHVQSKLGLNVRRCCSVERIVHQPHSLFGFLKINRHISPSPLRLRGL